MKPRTKIEIKVSELSNKTSLITNEVKEWAFKECLDHKAYATKNRVLCLDCGEVFSPKLVFRKKSKCPNCNTNVEVKNSRNTTDKQISYFAIAEIIEDFQVIRNFQLIAIYKKGVPVSYFLHEILQYWVNSIGYDMKYQTFGLMHNTQGNCDSWGGKMETRKENNYYQRKYDVYVDNYYPKSVFKQEYLKYGINSNLKGLSFLEAIRIIPGNSNLETLLKAKQYNLIQKSINSQINYYWNSIKICLRNKYFVKDASMYFDYLELLRYFKKDLRSPKYVCPKKLLKEHDILVKKKQIIQKKQKIENIKNQISESQKEYIKEKRKFFELEFKKGSLTISPIKEVRDFMDEGEELKHCVFTNEYYNKKDSLILTAKVNNKRVETVEICLSQMKIIQSRGEGNKNTKYNDKIIELVKSNLHRISQIVSN